MVWYHLVSPQRQHHDIRVNSNHYHHYKNKKNQENKKGNFQKSSQEPVERASVFRNIVRHIRKIRELIIKLSLRLKLNVKQIKRFRVGNSIEHKEMYKIKKMRNALDIFYIMLMLILPSSEPSGALVKKSEFGTSVSEPAFRNQLLFGFHIQLFESKKDA